VKTVFANFEPMRVSPARVLGVIRAKSPAVSEVLKLALMCGLVFGVYLREIKPLFENIAEAQEVLCGGVQNFVYAENGASATVYAVRTAEDWSYTQSEKDVLQMAAPQLRRDLWPNLDRAIFDLTQSNETKAIITPSFHGQMSDAEVPTERAHFELIKTIDSSSAMDNAGMLDCADYANAESPEVAIERLRAATNDTTISGCHDALHYCEELNYGTVRALCPETCGCHITVDMGSAAGFFGSPKFGCPTKCATTLRVVGEVMIEMGHGQFLPCVDWPGEAWELAPEPAQYYIRGLFEYLTHSDREHYKRHLENVLYQLEQANYLVLSQYNVTQSAFVTAMMNGTIRDDWSHFEWSLGLGVPHPRGLRGCEFLTSFEVTALLGLDLCDVGDYRSLRSICATSCGCVAKPNAGVECPSSCNHPTTRNDSRQIPQIPQYVWADPPPLPQ
jgi:hypothetical protein